MLWNTHTGKAGFRYTCIEIDFLSKNTAVLLQFMSIKCKTDPGGSGCSKLVCCAGITFVASVTENTKTNAESFCANFYINLSINQLIIQRIRIQLRQQAAQSSSNKTNKPRAQLQKRQQYHI